jgi:hypothetical protein
MKIINRILLLSFLFLSLTACCTNPITGQRYFRAAGIAAELKIEISDRGEQNAYPLSVQFTFINNSILNYRPTIRYIAFDENNNTIKEDTVYFDTILGGGKSQTKSMYFPRIPKIRTITITEALLPGTNYCLEGVMEKTYTW